MVHGCMVLVAHMNPCAIVCLSMAEIRFENYIDLIEAAAVLRIHPQSLRRLVKQGKVPTRLFAGKYLFERDVIETFKANYDPSPGRKSGRHLL